MPRTWDGNPARSIGLAATGEPVTTGRASSRRTVCAATPANGCPIRSIHTLRTPPWPGDGGTDPGDGQPVWARWKNDPSRGRSFNIFASP